jgi:formylglycine-generating enzyme required for sulfatase activity
MTRPTSAIIWIDEQRQLNTSPARFTLKPGTYVVAVQRDGYLRTEERVVLEPNRESKVEVVMPPGKEPPGMVLIPEGPFLMGQDGSAPDEAPRREIFVPAYYIDRTEVTNAQYKEVFTTHTYPEGEGSHPVSGVSFNDALDYAGKVGKRLPTEAEWEKAARGEDGRAYPWGEMFDRTLCNIDESGHSRPMPVGSQPLGASPYRVQDMAGNVYEWVDNWYEAYPGNQQVTKDYGQIFRVLRGGSYNTPRYDARCARRHFDRVDSARKDYGFRCVMDLPKTLQAGDAP